MSPGAQPGPQGVQPGAKGFSLVPRGSALSPGAQPGPQEVQLVLRGSAWCPGAQPGPQWSVWCQRVQPGPQGVQLVPSGLTLLPRSPQHVRAAVHAVPGGQHGSPAQQHSPTQVHEAKTSPQHLQAHHPWPRSLWGLVATHDPGRRAPGQRQLLVALCKTQHENTKYNGFLTVPAGQNSAFGAAM